MHTFCLNQIRSLKFLAVIMVTVFSLLACAGDGNDTGTDDSDQSGDVTISLTDAVGDFATYSVDVVSLTLTKANGTEISSLPLSTRIDFTQYTDMTEFLTVATVPSGVYVAATLTLDYTNADIWVEDEVGVLVQIQEIVDEDDNPLILVEMTVQLEDRNQLVIAPGIPMHLQLDFDLQATNKVEFEEPDDPKLIVDPYLVADVNRVSSKIHRLRGLLDEVIPEEQSFTVFIRPFYTALTGKHHRFGRMTVVTDEETLYDLNGGTYQGEEGLKAMQDLDPLTAIVVLGDLKFNPSRFDAKQVFAGSSVPWGDQDVISGTVIARQDNELTVKGCTLVQDDGSIIFHDTVTVTVGDETRVTRQLSNQSFTIQDISVGQRVTIFGTLTQDQPLNLALDATQGRVHMKLTTVRGTVIEVDEDNPVAQINLDLQSINRHRVTIFDFSGTGIDPTYNADPSDYEVNTGALDLNKLELGDPIKVRGFVQPFGAAPPDFNAQTIISVADVRAFMKVKWQPASMEAFTSILPDSLTLNLDGVGWPHHVYRSWVATDLTELDQPTTIQPLEDGSGLFIIHYGSVFELFLNFEDFSADLQNIIEEGWAVHKVWARGAFDDASATLTANMVDVHLK